MKQQVIEEMTTEELLERLEEEKKQMVKIKLAHTVSPIENPHKLTEYRRTIARMQTELRKRELEAESNK
jgi:large subunit ribosomal protein L29